MPKVLFIENFITSRIRQKNRTDIVDLANLQKKVHKNMQL